MVDLSQIPSTFADLYAKFRSAPRMYWGTVTQSSPLMVRRDGSIKSDGSPGDPVQVGTTIAGLVPGDRVRMDYQDNRYTVLGLAGGQSASAPGVIPIGGMVEWAAAAAPTGWLLAQGQAVSRTTYAELFSLLGTTYGSGNGSTTFNLPDRRGRVGVGMTTADTEFNALGKTFGAKTHTLTVAEMPSHDHPPMAGQANIWGWSGGSGGEGSAGSGASSVVGRPNTGTRGGGGAHNNIQPSIALNYIIRAL